MDEVGIISNTYKELKGCSDFTITPLPRSGSERRYFRIVSGSECIIGAFNPDPEENEAFIGFTSHFREKGLPVPEIFYNFPEKRIYFLQDLGNSNLYTWLHERSYSPDFDLETKQLYRKILDKLILFQTDGIEGLDLELCYPHKSFDRQSMMWDMNYFKYMFLKLVAAPFNERRLEHDFQNMADYLLEAGQDYFLYRDFQTANFMIVKGEPWFIDYQGGRKGAPQYDVASFLNDAKIRIAEDVKEELLEYYIMNFCAKTNTSPEYFRSYYAGFSMIRLMQALGAFGFRGLYEQKPTFTESIIPAVQLLQQVIIKAEKDVKLDELYDAINAIPGTEKYKYLAGASHL